MVSSAQLNACMTRRWLRARTHQRRLEAHAGQRCHRGIIHLQPPPLALRRLAPRAPPAPVTSSWRDCHVCNCVHAVIAHLHNWAPRIV